jgi:hypothetical protein
MWPDPGWFWTDLLIGSILHREAGAVIRDGLDIPAGPLAR